MASFPGAVGNSPSSRANPARGARRDPVDSSGGPDTLRMGAVRRATESRRGGASGMSCGEGTSGSASSSGGSSRTGGASGRLSETESCSPDSLAGSGAARLGSVISTWPKMRLARG
jgi:hypothetical protein